jgi:hypothetical protein
MTTFSGTADGKSLLGFGARPAFLLACAAILLVFLLPNAIERRRVAQFLILALSSIAIVTGWFCSARYADSNAIWRKLAAILTAVYLSCSVPAFVFELSSLRWLMTAPNWVSVYLSPWVHWGDILILLGIAGALCGRGKARIAFVTASILQLILWESMGRWIL